MKIVSLEFLTVMPDKKDISGGKTSILQSSNSSFFLTSLNPLASQNINQEVSADVNSETAGPGGSASVSSSSSSIVSPPEV